MSEDDVGGWKKGWKNTLVALSVEGKHQETAKLKYENASLGGG